MADYAALKHAHKDQSPREAAAAFKKDGTPNPNAENLPSFGTINTPTGPYNPLTNVAYSGDIQGIASGVENIKWGAAQLNRGIAHAKGHKASIIGMARANVFEFPVFISDSVPLEFATATNTLLEQVYASYLQIAISINPVVDHTMIRERQGTSPFAKYKTNTSDYIECVDLTFQKDSCHNIVFNDDDGTVFEYNMCSIEDSDAQIMLEAIDYQPLSEFNHYFMESKIEDDADDFIPEIRYDNKQKKFIIAMPEFDAQGNPKDNGKGRLKKQIIDVFDSQGNLNADLAVAYSDLVNYRGGRKIEIKRPDGSSDMVSRRKFEDLIKTAELEKALLENDVARQLRDARIREGRANADAAEHSEKLRRQELNAALRKLGNYIGKNPNSLNGAERTEYLNAMKVLREAKEFAADERGYERLIDKFDNGIPSTADLEKLSEFLKVKKQLNDQERDAYERDKSREQAKKEKLYNKKQNVPGSKSKLTPNEAEAREKIDRGADTHHKVQSALKKLSDIIGSGEITSDKIKNLNAYDRAQVLDAINTLDAVEEFRGKKASLDQIKQAFERGDHLTDGQLRTLNDYYRAVKAKREELEAADTVGGKTKARLDLENRNEELKEKRRKNREANRKVDVNGKRLTDDQIRLLSNAENLRQLENAKDAEEFLDNYIRANYGTPNQVTTADGTPVANLAQLKLNSDLLDELGKQATNRMFINKLNDYNGFIEKFGMTPDQFDAEIKLRKDQYEANKDKREERKLNYELNKTKAPEFLDENKLKKMNTMKPLMMTVTMSIMADDGHVSHPMEYVVGVKTHCRIIKSSTLPEVIEYPVKEMDKISRKAKWRAGELKFFKDILFHVKEKKQTAIDSRDPNRKWYRRLYELAHMKGDGNVSKKIAGSGAVNGLIPNATVIISKSDVDNIENVTKIDMLKASTAINFCEQLFLIGFVVIDVDNESIKVLIPEINNEFDVQSLAAVNKQIAELDTAGKSTRDVFKMLR